MDKLLIAGVLAILYIAGAPRTLSVKEIKANIAESKTSYIANAQIGIDISQYNPINWNMFVQSDDQIEFIFMRATCGAIRDKALVYNMDNIKRHGLQKKISIGFYHFYKWQVPIARQISAFKTQWEAYAPFVSMPPVIDIEYNPSVKDHLFTPEQEKTERSELTKFLTEIARITKNTPILYTNKDYYKRWIEGTNLANQPIWLAHYDDIDDIVSNVSDDTYKHIRNLAMIQYSDKGKINASKGNIDFNILFTPKQKKP